MALKHPLMAWLKSISPKLWEILNSHEQAINQLGQYTTVNPTGVSEAPQAIQSISVTAADGIHHVVINDASKVTRGVNYFAEYDTNPGFTNPHVEDLGASRTKRIFIGNQTVYWRGYSGYVGSPPSPPVPHCANGT